MAVLPPARLDVVKLKRLLNELVNRHIGAPFGLMGQFLDGAHRELGFGHRFAFRGSGLSDNIARKRAQTERRDGLLPILAPW